MGNATSHSGRKADPRTSPNPDSSPHIVRIIVGAALNARGTFRPRHILDELQAAAIRATLAKSKSISEAADFLGICRASLQRKIKRLKIGGAA